MSQPLPTLLIIRQNRVKHNNNTDFRVYSIGYLPIRILNIIL